MKTHIAQSHFPQLNSFLITHKTKIYILTVSYFQITFQYYRGYIITNNSVFGSFLSHIFTRLDRKTVTQSQRKSTFTIHIYLDWVTNKTNPFYMCHSTSIVLLIVNKLINNRSASLAWQYTAKHLYCHTLLQNDLTLNITRRHQGLTTLLSLILGYML